MQFITMPPTLPNAGVTNMEPHAPLFPSFMTPLSDLYGANGFRVGESYAYTQDLDELDREELAFEQSVRALVDRPAPTPTGVKFHRPHGSGMATPSTTAPYPTQYQAGGPMTHGRGFGERHQDEEEEEDDEDDMEEDEGDDMEEVAEEEITAEDDDEELFPEDDEEDQEEDGSMDLSMDMDD
ncbi:hypothetical protein Poli38472_001792 [Pythium oligandrum]|uniref:Uncharacterized protein n=1 Tax=Pythium oligandrum TaxID=41045 RepID=A0A8K1CTL4_PYTOL|nr:hypothetical protein Poli38472_001792 [Pythium oligandrum]|eukprot:TMW69636.1 hypothetical protein Poli38472_001792 [Pythium oligandrum]